MRCTKRYIIFLSFFLQTFSLTAQNITGTWEGDMGDHQFLQLNIIQNGKKLCGYTRDYVKDDTNSYCKAYFEGYYFKKPGEWLLYGTSFIEKNGFHYLMRINLTATTDAGGITLNGESAVSTASLISYTMDPFGTDPFDSLNLRIPDPVHLIKISDRPQQVLRKMKDCFLEEQKLKTKALLTSVPARPADTVFKSVLITNDSLPNYAQLVKRKNTEQSHIEVTVKNIILNVYDNAIIDNDTVSIFYNGRLLLNHQQLSQKPIVINIALDEKQTRHEIILFAENLGSIPPNTALIVIYAGDKRYELYSSASLKENAVLVFEYKPK